MAYDVEMHEDDDFQKTLDMADETKPKKVFQTFHWSLFDFFSKAKIHRSSMQNHSQNVWSTPSPGGDWKRDHIVSLMQVKLEK